MTVEINPNVAKNDEPKRERVRKIRVQVVIPVFEDGLSSGTVIDS